jgi:multicomponent Na+:H+ antiporter subunit C
MVDPVPQALMLTAIVIGVCINALALALAYRLHTATGSFNIETIYQRLNNNDND